MFKPDDPLRPRDAVFAAVWQAQTLAIADTMVRAGHFSASDWAQTLGEKLKSASDRGAPDTTDTYYQCALDALETLLADNTAIDLPTMRARKDAWTRSYLATPHGRPVVLAAGQKPH